MNPSWYKIVEVFFEWQVLHKDGKSCNKMENLFNNKDFEQ